MHPLNIGDVLERADNSAQIPSHGRLQGQQSQRVVLDAGNSWRDFLQLGDHLFGQLQVGLQKRLRGAFHRQSRLLAHLGDAGRQTAEILLESLSHTDPP